MGNIDFNRKYLVVQRGIVNGRINLTKTGKSRRVALSDELLDGLESWKSRCREQWLQKGQNEIPEWVLAMATGNPAQMQNIVNRF